MSDTNQAVQEKKTDKELYDYQQGAISQIFEKFDMYCTNIIVDYQNLERILVLKKEKISNKD